MKTLLLLTTLVNLYFAQAQADDTWTPFNCTITDDYAIVKVEAWFLKPDQEWKFYQQKDGSAVFKGPIALSNTFENGKLITLLPNVSKDDRIMAINSETNIDFIFSCNP